jgi:hypothetical protein
MNTDSPVNRQPHFSPRDETPVTMSKMKNKRTDDAVEILHRRYVTGKPERAAELERIRADDDVARKI